MYIDKMLDDLRVISKTLRAIEGKDGKAYKLTQGIKRKLKIHDSLFGKVVWSIADIAEAFKDQKEKVPAKKELIKISGEIDGIVAEYMIDKGWDVITGSVQDYIYARNNGGK